LTNSFGTIQSTEFTTTQAGSKKHGWLPLLTILFLLSYGLMTMLIVEQGRTIESQRALIQVLFHDSTELSAVKMKAHQKQVGTAPMQAENSSSQKQSTQIPSTQAPSHQIPSTQGSSQSRVQSQTEKQKPFRMPSRPASDLTDARRALISI